MRIFLEGIEVFGFNSDRVAITRQINSIFKPSTRQSSFTRTIEIPSIADNIRTLEFLGLIGDVSRLPYRKIRAMVLDEDSNDWLVYDGWATIQKTAVGKYEIYIYDGVIDIYKAIENKKLTDLGISELNHVKNVANIIETWTNTSLPYRYNVADYGGQTITLPLYSYPNDPTPEEPGEDAGQGVEIQPGGDINADYLTPSFRASYMWDKLHAYAGKTYEGEIFNTEDFLNWWITFPKPVPTNDPVVENITEQGAVIVTTPTNYPTESGFYLGAIYTAVLLNGVFDTPYMNNTNGLINITESGAFRVSLSGTFTTGEITNGLVNWKLFDAANVLKSQGQIDAAQNQSVIILAEAGDRLQLLPVLFGSNSPAGFFPLSGDVETIVDYIVGYNANFEEALIDFNVKDFFNAVVHRFSLFVIPDRYTNKIKYLTLDEIIQNPPLDWSRKNPVFVDDTYNLSSYAQRNRYKYRYNDQNENFNDGHIFIDNVNLSDETTIFTSPFYSPEKRKNLIYLGFETNVYPIWNKQIKDNGDVEYKELAGRYYSQRSELKEFALPVKISSPTLGITESVSALYRESFYRLSMSDILTDNYSSIGRILNDAVVKRADLYLTPRDISTFEFDRMIYIEQFGNYYIVDKIPNFVPGKITRCDLIQVRYYSPDIDDPQIIEGTYINITDINTDECTAVVSFTTDAPTPFSVRLVATKNTISPIPLPEDIIDITYNDVMTGEVNVDFPSDGYWSVRLFLNDAVYSLPYYIDIENCSPIDPDPDECTPTGISITSLTSHLTGPNPGIQFNFCWQLQGVTQSFGCPPIKIICRLTLPNGTILNNEYSGVFGGPESCYSAQFNVQPSTWQFQIIAEIGSGVFLYSQIRTNP